MKSDSSKTAERDRHTNRDTKDVHPTRNVSASASQGRLLLPSLGGEILRSWGYILFTLLCPEPHRTRVGPGPREAPSHGF